MASSIHIPNKLIYQVIHERYQLTIGDSIFYQIYRQIQQSENTNNFAIVTDSHVDPKPKCDNEANCLHVTSSDSSRHHLVPNIEMAVNNRK